MQPDYRFIDADNHYYEPVDRFLAYFDSGTLKEGFRVDDENRLFVGDEPLYSGPESPMALPLTPGSHLELYTTMRMNAAVPTYDVPATEVPEFCSRDARLEVMDAQNVEAGIFYGSLGLLPEDQLAERKGPDLLYRHIRGYNRYAEEEWGFAHRNRIFAAPLLALDDLDRSLAELREVLGRGARVIQLTPRPTIERRSPGDPHFDPFWARVSEAGVLVAVHIGMNAYYYVQQSGFWGENGLASLAEWTPFQRLVAMQDRPIMDFLGALILHGLFERHPKLRVLSVENSVSWLPYFVRKLEQVVELPFSPIETFKRHVYHTPVFTDDIRQAMDLVGDSQIVFGSDYPHPEGPAQPSQFIQRLEGVPEMAAHRFLRATNASLLGLPV